MALRSEGLDQLQSRPLDLGYYKRRGRTKKALIEVLRSFRDDYLDEIPEMDVSGSNPEYHNRKVRSNWFAGWIGTAQIGMNRGFFPVEKIEEVRGHLSYFTGSPAFLRRARTTSHDIWVANNVLTSLIGDRLVDWRLEQSVD